MNWRGNVKTSNLLVVIILTLITPLASFMFVSGVPDILVEFKSNSTTLVELVASVYILGFAVGPLLLSPLSQLYCRKPIYMICNIMFVVFTVACAVSKSLTRLIVFRFFAGYFGGTIADDSSFVCVQNIDRRPINLGVR